MLIGGSRVTVARDDFPATLHAGLAHREPCLSSPLDTPYGASQGLVRLMISSMGWTELRDKSRPVGVSREGYGDGGWQGCLATRARG